MNTQNHRTALLSLTLACALAASGSTAMAAGCGGCGSHDTAAKSGDDAAAGGTGSHGDHAAATPAVANPTTAEVLPAPVPSVLANYAKIGAALSGDSLAGLPATAETIAQLVKGDAAKTLPAEVATQADALAQAKTLETARANFKALSTALIGYLELAQGKTQTGKYYEVHCAMAQASWLQTDKAIKNPYYGASMLKCGEIKRVF